MSIEPAEDLISFMKWAERNAEWYPFPKKGLALDVGCGNGRNLIYLCKKTGMEGFGIDISSTAISQAKKAAGNLPIDFKAGLAEDPLPLPDSSCDVILDMMTTHFLNKKQRESYKKELVRVTKPYAWLFFKTFVLEGDSHAKRLIEENGGKETNTYIHPKIGTAEHVFTEMEIHHLFEPEFKIHKMLKSYKHVLDGKAHKRRTISVYMERMRD